MKNNSFFRLLCAVFITTSFWQNTAVAQVAYAVGSEDQTTLTFYYDNDSASRAGTVYKLNEGGRVPGWSKRVSGWPEDNPNITSVVFDDSFKDARPTTCYMWLAGFVNLSTIKGISNLNTSGVTDMSEMFYDCLNLTSLDLSGFDTHNVEDMNNMFSGCKKINNLDLSAFNTAKVVDMHKMFWNCSNLTNLDLSGFDTRKVIDMSFMFHGCSGLSTLNLSGFNTENVYDMSGMFYTTNLKNLDLSSFNTQNVHYMRYMFYGCALLRNLDLSGFNTCNVQSMVGMFQCCYSLTTLDISGFNTTNVTYMTEMFQSCGITAIDLSSFNTQNVTDMSKMFYACRSLTTILVSDYWTMANVKSSDNMFNGCSSVKGSNGTSYDATKVDAAYAQIDKKGTPGYFSYQKAQVVAFTNTQNLTYSGEEQPLIATNVTNLGLPLYSLDGITYTETIPTATNAGVYVVYVKVEDNEKYTGIEPISINVKIGKAIAQISKPPVANEKLSYNTQEQELVKGGKVNIGFISFSLDGKTYSKTIPSAIAPGNYTVYYKIMETDNYTGVEAESIDVTINKGSRYYRNKPLSIKDLHYTGEAQALISEGEIIEGIILYSLDGTNYSENIPTAIEVGEYTVYYKVDPTDNYNPG